MIGSVVRAVKSHSSGKKPNFDPKPQKSRNDSSYQFLTQNRKNPEMTVPISNIECDPVSRYVHRSTTAPPETIKRTSTFLRTLQENGFSSYQLPISRFNKGEANKIFSDVKKFGTRIVVKNNVPECVLISPQVYRQMVEEYENAILSSEAEKRFSQNVEYTDHEDLMRKVCLTDSE